MQFNFTGRNVAVTPALRHYAEGKLSRLNRFMDGLGTVHVVFSVERHRQVAEVTLAVRDLLLRAEESTPDLYASLDQVADKLERQLLRHKEKLVAHGPGRRATGEAPGRSPERPEGTSEPGKKAGAGGGARPAASAAAGPGGEAPGVVRVKRFALRPMAVEDAVLQMELLGHAFFVFRNDRTEEVNVLYRRRDGAYGLIEPEA